MNIYQRIKRVWKDTGGLNKQFMTRLWLRIKAILRIPVSTRKQRRKLEEILAQHPDKTMIIFKPAIDWNAPLFQRPQHLAIALAKRNFLYLFCTPNNIDNVNGVIKVAENCYVTNLYEYLLKHKREKIVHLYAHDITCSSKNAEAILEHSQKILYEYIDEIHADISGKKISTDILNRHDQMISNEQVFCLATADKLLTELLSKRQKNCTLVTNGVDIIHFSPQYNLKKTCPAEILPIINKNKPIIGYFGAMAKWFDYELILKLAQERPQYEILLIGWNYDGSLLDYDLEKKSNIHIIGPINYQILPNYAQWFSVATVPFLINNITESTSPIKIFEYMALEKPIVSTNLPECRKYPTILIGHDHNEFIENIDSAILLSKDKTYIQALQESARQNSWDAKADQIINLIGEG
jgi:teichuronic acid biosynthesis glycosyltransferase TuaH